MKRQVLVATIGAVLGILGGLYFSLSTILFFLMGFFLAFATMRAGFKPATKVAFFKAGKKILRYFRVVFKTDIIIIFIISMLISVFYVKIKNRDFEKIIPGERKGLVGKIQSDPKENEYTYSYKIRIDDKLYILYLKKKNGAKEFEYGDIIKLDGKLELPEEARNFGGFSQRDYYKSKGIYGIIYTENAQTIGSSFDIGKLASIIRMGIKRKTSNYISKENAGVLLGILIGDKSKLEENMIESFRRSSLIHILCVSRSTCRIYNYMGSKVFFKVWKKKEIFNIIACNYDIDMHNRLFSFSNKSMYYGDIYDCC